MFEREHAGNATVPRPRTPETVFYRWVIESFILLHFV
jgi:hypothetical protein